MKKVQRSTLLRSADRPEIEFKVACDVTSHPVTRVRSDVTGNFKLDFRAID